MLTGAIAGLALAFGLLVLKAKVGAVVAALYALAGSLTLLGFATGLGFFAFVGAMAALYVTSEKFRDFTGGIFGAFIEEGKELRDIVMAIVNGLQKINDFDLRDVPGFGWIPEPEGFNFLDPFGVGDSLLGMFGISTESKQSAGTTINVNMPAGSDGQDVVAALQRYTRQNGAADIRTSGAVVI